MFTLLDGLNRFLGFSNLKPKYKNRLYIILGTITTGYIGYLTIKFFRYAAYKRGVVFLLIFISLVYFLILNIFYYFFDKTVKWDISRYFEKIVQVEEVSESEKHVKKKAGGLYDGRMVIYDELPQEFLEKQTFKASLSYLANGEVVVKELVDFLLNNQLVEIVEPAKNSVFKSKKIKTTEKNYLLGTGVQIPSFVLEQQSDQLVLWIGLNATERKPVAVLEQVGEISATKVIETYDVVATEARITGGEYIESGRAASLTKSDPYIIELEVVCLVKLPV